MFKGIFLSALLAFSLVFAAKAQDDSVHYDLGRVLVNKSATQTTSISGHDLEKYQASNLSDAVNVWLYGTYSTSSSIIYVIDGNIISDVNAYSIFDIEEITLVQTSVAQVSGASPGQQMVLIKTRNHRPGKKGIEFNGQSSLVNLRDKAGSTNRQSSNNVYSQYYVAAYRNFKKGDIGASAEYQHDVDPSLNGSGLDLLVPSNYNRLKFNTFANDTLWKGTTLVFGTSFVPQVNNSSYSLDTLIGSPSKNEHSDAISHVSQHLLNVNINLKSDIAKGLANRFSVAYNHYNYFEEDATNMAANPNDTAGNLRAIDRSHNLLIRDYLYYHGQAGNFDIESTVNFTYRNFEDSLDYRSSTLYSDGVNQPALFNSLRYFDVSYKALMLSPSFNIYYKEIFDMQGGFVGLLNIPKVATPGTSANHIFPYFSSSLNVGKLTGISLIKWRINFSFARQSPILADSYSSMASFNLISNSTFLNDVLSNLNPYQQYNNYQAGTSVGITKNVSVSYSYEYRSFHSLAQVVLPINVANIIGFVPYNYNTLTNHFSLNYTMHTTKFTWNATLNGTESELKIVGNPATVPAAYSAYLSNGHRWSGGFTNRITYKNVFTGLDFLYQAGERPFSLLNAVPTAQGYVAPSNNTSLTLQNAYIGVRVAIPYMKYAEIYASGRNILQNGSSDITDNRRFYGGGVKLGL